MFEGDRRDGAPEGMRSWDMVLPAWQIRRKT